jgi:hypothetical protein
MTSKATVKANKSIHTGKIITPETPIRRNLSAPRVDFPFHSIYILLET